jgi:hypothetical protein
MMFIPQELVDAFIDQVYEDLAGKNDQPQMLGSCSLVSKKSIPSLQQSFTRTNFFWKNNSIFRPPGLPTFYHLAICEKSGLELLSARDPLEVGKSRCSGVSRVQTIEVFLVNWFCQFSESTDVDDQWLV